MGSEESLPVSGQCRCRNAAGEATELTVDDFDSAGNIKYSPGDPDNITIVFAHMEGCPHCVHFRPTFDQVVKMTKTCHICFKTVEASDRKTIAKLSKLMGKPITGFPTIIKIVDGRKVVPYDQWLTDNKRRDRNSQENFLTFVLV